MSPVSRGFRHRHRASDEDAGRLPPGQYVTEGFPVLSAGPTPHTPLEEWTFSITQGGQTRKSWTWQEFRAMPAETITADIHCVTRWSKLDTEWRGVSVDTLLDQVEARRAVRDGVLRRRLHHQPAARRRHRRPGVGGLRLRRRPAGGRARRPGAAAGAAPVLLEERQVGARPRPARHDEPGFWETYGYHMYGDPWREQRYAGD